MTRRRTSTSRRKSARRTDTSNILVFRLPPPGPDETGGGPAKQAGTILKMRPRKTKGDGFQEPVPVVPARLEALLEQLKVRAPNDLEELIGEIVGLVRVRSKHRATLEGRLIETSELRARVHRMEEEEKNARVLRTEETTSLREAVRALSRAQDRYDEIRDEERRMREELAKLKGFIRGKGQVSTKALRKFLGWP